VLHNYNIQVGYITQGRLYPLAGVRSLPLFSSPVSAAGDYPIPFRSPTLPSIFLIIYT